MRDLIREQLLARIQPALEQLAEQMIDMLLDRIELHVNQLELAFDAATSAFASDLSVMDGAARRYDVRTNGHGSGSEAQRRSRVASRLELIQERDEDPARTVESDAASTAGDAGLSEHRSGECSPQVNPALQQGQDLPPSTSSPSHPPVKDRICGSAARGPHRKGCSLPNISTSPASDHRRPALTTSSPATSPISVPSSATATSARSTRLDRFAQIEASRAQRELAKRDRAERARSFIRRDGMRPTRGPARDQAEPIATFEF